MNPKEAGRPQLTCLLRETISSSKTLQGKWLHKANRAGASGWSGLSLAAVQAETGVRGQPALRVSTPRGAFSSGSSEVFILLQDFLVKNTACVHGVGMKGTSVLPVWAAGDHLSEL